MPWRPGAEGKRARPAVWRIVSIAIGLIAITLFFFTEDMAQPMAMADAFTLFHAAILMVQAALVLIALNLSRKDSERVGAGSLNSPASDPEELPTH